MYKIFVPVHTVLLLFWLDLPPFISIEKPKSKVKFSIFVLQKAAEIEVKCSNMYLSGLCLQTNTTNGSLEIPGTRCKFQAKTCLKYLFKFKRLRRLTE